MTLAAVGSLFSIGSISAEETMPSDFKLVVNATEQSDLDYDKLKTKLLQRYSPAIEQMEAAESSYTTIFSGSLIGTSTTGSGSIPKGYKPWWQARANGRINEAVPTSLYGHSIIIYPGTGTFFTNQSLQRLTAHPSNNHPGSSGTL